MKKIVLDLRGVEIYVPTSSFLFQSLRISNKISIHVFLDFTSKLFRIKIGLR